jgi:hypothetical protein
MTDHGQLMTALVLAQGTDETTQDPLIAQGTDDVIYIGVFLLAIVATIAIGILNGRLRIAILMALFLSGILIALIVAV